MMRPTFVIRLNALCAAVALALAAAHAAEPKQPSLVGLSRDQLIARLGEPKSQIVAGNRVVLFFARDRVVLRDGVVVEVERLPGETPRASTPAPVPAPAPPESQSTAPATADRAAPTTPTSGTTPPATSPAASTTTQKAGSITASGSAIPATNTPEPTTPPEPKFEIKGVRSGSAPRTPPKQDTSAPTTSGAATTVTTTQPSAPRTPAPTEPNATAPVAPNTPRPTTTMPAQTPDTSAPSSASVATVTPPTEAEEPKPVEVTPAEEKDTKAKTPPKKQARRKRVASEPDIPDTEEIISTRSNWYIVFAVTGIGVGYLLWRSQQRRLALAATAVSRTPFSTPVAAKATGAVFNAQLLQELEWKRFEELVAAYYVKTGVVAVRTKSGPAAPVHIKISWKGEPRPFAYVQCLAHPQGLIDAKPLQELVNVLAAEDIRRGYVVTTGKFGVSARDLAEEKHITLLPGDIFLEKLNALPDAARSEIMQQITTGDYKTPSCPKCEAKMVKSPDDPSMWRCTAHPDQQIPAQ